ncbi:MAG: hypothetical protein DMG42_04400 [Acidobacteria bacterium]|nr:MAG: hypothetical protein DMG42_04400 [Acidobacteriota bacterium]
MPALVEATDSPFIAEALSAPAPHLQALAKQLAGDPELVLAAVDALGSLSPRIRFAASRLLHIVSKRAPEALYPHFACLARLLKDKNSILRWNAMLALGNLAPADRENKLDAILEAYLAPISGGKLVDAANAMRGAAAIACGKTYLADEIRKSILAVEQARYATRECRNLAIGHAIRALDVLFPALQNRQGVLSFVRRQRTNPRRATRNKARKFLAKWPAASGQTGACAECDYKAQQGGR